MIETLISLGENEEELRFWERIFPSLGGSEQEKLIALLEEELSMLKGVTIEDQDRDVPVSDGLAV
jgi:hypothetical protein